MNRKILAAVLAVGLALTGVISGIRWLTVVALVLWIAAMLLFGLGDRSIDRSDAEAD